MTCKGKVTKGVVLLPPDVELPDGTEVVVETLTDDRGKKSLHQRLAAFAGMADDLPSDLAENHDRYLHGRAGK
jgi:hypothetical protein